MTGIKGEQGAISVSMISCKQCGTHNSLDSTFCKKCGTGIGEDDIQEGRAKLELLTAEGTVAFNEGRTDEALAIAESVLLSDPDSIPALWLKAICHERRDEIAAALECADRIVELNPDSDLDKIRRNQLRTKLNSQLQVIERPDRRVALIGAVAACVLVLCIGALAANMARGRTDAGTVALNEPQKDPLQKEASTGNPSTPNQANTQANQGNQAPINPGGSANGQLRDGDVGALGNSTQPPVNNQTAEPKIPNYSGDSLPTVEGNGEIKPIDPNILKVVPNTKPQGNNQGSKSQDDPGPIKDPVPIPNAVEEDPGTIEITVHNNGSKSGAADSNGAKSQSLTANAAYELGNYSKAASLFEQAIRSGGDPVGLNQRLGQSYERLGRTGDAVEAYKRAISAGESALASGRGNPDRIRSAVESCQQALRKLGG